MHIPPYYKKESWQRFFVGTFIGAIIAYGVFLFMYGTLYEKQQEENFDLKSQVTELKNQNEALTQDKKDLNERTQEPSTIEKIDIKIENAKDLKMDSMLIHQLEEMIKQEISHLVGKEIEIISNSDQLLISTIENKGFTVDDFTYYFDVSFLAITQTVRLTVKAKLSE